MGGECLCGQIPSSTHIFSRCIYTKCHLGPGCSRVSGTQSRGEAVTFGSIHDAIELWGLVWMEEDDELGLAERGTALLETSKARSFAGGQEEYAV